MKINKGKPIFVGAIIPSCAYAYRLICGAKMVPNSTKPTYIAICEDTSENGKKLENTGFFLASINTCRKL